MSALALSCDGARIWYMVLRDNLVAVARFARVFIVYVAAA